MTRSNSSTSCAPGTAHWPLITNVGTAVMPLEAAIASSSITSA